MRKLAAYLRPYLPAYLAAALLIFIQVMSNLNLPRLMSEIVDKGIMLNDTAAIWRLGG